VDLPTPASWNFRLHAAVLQAPASLPNVWLDLVSLCLLEPLVFMELVAMVSLLEQGLVLPPDSPPLPAVTPSPSPSNTSTP